MHYRSSRDKTNDVPGVESTIEQTVRTYEKMASEGNECYVSFLMDSTFDLYVFHFLEWSKAANMKLSRVQE